MLDLVTGAAGPTVAGRTQHGSFPIVAWSQNATVSWGLEAIMLTAGSCVDWLVEDLGLLGSAAESHAVASTVATTEDVFFVPAMIGLGTPHWDYGARGTLIGVTRGTTKAHVVRSVLEGVAHRGADLLEAAEADAGRSVATLRIDGGMSANPTFVQALADATGRPIEVAPYTECTTLGAGFLAGVGVGLWDDLGAVEAAWRPTRVVEPSTTSDHGAVRARWAEAVERSSRWIPALSALDF
jgi:glycerol kinase